jgi:hypothetical protein
MTNPRKGEAPPEGKQAAAIIDLLWDYMRRDPEHTDRVRTGFGTKTQQGLVASVRRVVLEVVNE